MHSQINAYAKVTGITGGGTRLALSNVNQTYGSFVAGDKVLIIQMQGATIGTMGNNSNFGNNNSLNSAGLYEVAVIAAVNGAVTSLTLAGSLDNTYSTNRTVQIVSFPELSAGNYTTTSNISALPFDGNIGGVIAFGVGGNLVLRHQISADGAGFRGGAKSGQDGGACESNTWRVAAGDAKYSAKGEGVYMTSNGQKAGKAKAVNGGGGGIVHNGGGGGGGNYTAGGAGYYGYTGSGYCSSTKSAGGQGGLAVSSNIGRVFMGGGGGGGQENDNVGSNGGDGGGIIFIKCDTIISDGSCVSRRITANGDAAAASGNDGAGGGGGGGTIVLDVDGVRAVSSCPLIISANGGNGGDVNNGASHGAGGGGGQGALYIRASGPFNNTTFQTTNGSGGDANTSWSSPQAGSGAGSNNAGVKTGQTAVVLPVTLLSFAANQRSSMEVEVRWACSGEMNVRSYSVLHSSDGGNWLSCGTVEAVPEHAGTNEYSLSHYGFSEGINYYKLQENGPQGSCVISQIVYVDVTAWHAKSTVFPNPATRLVTVRMPEAIKGEELQLRDASGRRVSFQLVEIKGNQAVLNVKNLPEGMYVLSAGNIHNKIFVKRRP